MKVDLTIENLRQALLHAFVTYPDQFLYVDDFGVDDCLIVEGDLCISMLAERVMFELNNHGDK